MLAFLGGCATPLKVDIQDLSPTTKAQATGMRVADIKLVNRATDPKFVNDLFDDSFVPIRTDPSTKKTVEADIDRLLRNMLEVDPTAPTTLFVKVQRAEAFWVYGVVDRIPFVGLATAGSDREFLMNVSFQIEVEQQGKVKNTYAFEEKISTQGSAAFSSDIREAYEILVQTYRPVLERALRVDFIDRYL